MRMALPKTALIRAPQRCRRPGRLCQDTCHGFPPAILTRTAVWRGACDRPSILSSDCCGGDPFQSLAPPQHRRTWIGSRAALLGVEHEVVGSLTREPVGSWELTLTL